MIRKSLCGLMCLGFALFAIPSTHAQPLKIGIVDMNKIFMEYYKTKDAESKLNEQRANAKKEFDDRVENLKKNMDEINKLNQEIDRPELSKEAKETKIKARDEKVGLARNQDRDLGEFRQARERQLQEQFMRMRKDILDEITKIVDEEVKARGYDIVLDKSGISMGQVPVVVYSRNDLDFSSAVISKLNVNAPKVKSSK